jgi:hypothetical protein
MGYLYRMGGTKYEVTFDAINFKPKFQSVGSTSVLHVYIQLWFHNFVDS